VLAPLFFIALACLGGHAVGAFGLVAAMANARLFLGDFALFRLAQPRIGERMRTSAAFFFGKGAKDDTGRSSRRGRRRRRWRTCRSGGRRPRCGDTAFCCRRATVGSRDRLRLDFTRTGDAAFDLLDHHGLAATMTELLAHHALIDAAAL